MESSSVERVSALTLLRRQFSSSNQNMITLTPPISEYTLSPQNAEQNRENLYHRSQIQSQQVSTTVLPDNSQMQIQVSIPAFPDDSHMQIQQVSIPVFPNASQMQKQQVPMSVFSNDSQMQKQQVSTPVNINNYHIQKQQMPNFYYQCQPQLQQPQLHHEHQHFNGYCDNYSYTRTPWSNQNQSSNNYVGTDYQPAVHGHTSTMMQQPEGLYYPPQNSYEYNPVNVNYNLPQGHQLPQGLPRPSTIKPRRTRTFYTPYQLLELEKLFVSKKYPIRTERIETSLRLKMTEKQVKVWFQNRRIKLRKAESMGNASPSKSSKRDQTLSCKKENVDIQTLSCKKENADIEDIENINKTIDTEAEAHILREMQDSVEAEAFEKGVIYMTSRPDEISLILDAAEEKLS